MKETKTIKINHCEGGIQTMKETKTIKINHCEDLPDNFTGIAEYQNGTKYWIKTDILHREDGPAVEYSDGMKMWCLEGKRYMPINLKDFMILDSYKGEYGIMWYKLLDKDNIFEYPDIPGLITK